MTNNFLLIFAASGLLHFAAAYLIQRKFFPIDLDRDIAYDRESLTQASSIFGFLFAFMYHSPMTDWFSELASNPAAVNRHYVYITASVFALVILLYVWSLLNYVYTRGYMDEIGITFRKFPFDSKSGKWSTLLTHREAIFFAKHRFVFLDGTKIRISGTYSNCARLIALAQMSEGAVIAGRSEQEGLGSTETL